MKAEEPKDFLVIFIIVFIAGFVLWYLTGGPERWNKKVKENGWGNSVFEPVNIVK